MNMQAVGELLAGTTLPDNAARANAERGLRAMYARDGFYASLLQICTIETVPPQIRMAAALMLKNAVKGTWTRPAEKPRAGRHKIPAGDRAVILDNICEAAVVQPSKPVRKALLECVKEILRLDAGPGWPKLGDDVQRNLSSGEPARVYGGMLLLMAVFKRFVSAFRDKRRIANEYFVRFEDFLLQALGSLSAQRDTADAAEMRRVLFKTVCLATMMQLPPSWEAQFDRANAFFALAAAELMTAEPAATASARPGAARQAKAHFYAFKLVCRAFTRFGRPAFVEKDLQPWSAQFVARTAPEVLRCSLRLLEVQRADRSLHPELLHLVYNFLDAAVCEGALFPMFKPHAAAVLIGCVVPSIGMTARDLEMIQENADEYIRRSNTEISEFVDPRVTAANLLVSLLKSRAATARPLVLGHIEQVFGAYAAAPEGQRDVLAKEACMRTLACLRNFLMGAEFRAVTEAALAQHVVPETRNPHDFMRASAVRTLGEFYQFDWSTPERYEAYTMAVASTLQDPATIVRVQASLAVSRLVRRPETVRFLSPKLRAVLENYISLLHSPNGEAVVSYLADLVQCVGAEVAPMAPELVQQFILAFNEYMRQAENEDEEDEGTAVMAAIQVTYCIHSTVQACSGKPAPYAACEALLVPWMHEILSNPRLFELYDCVGEMAATLARHGPDEPTPAVWGLLPRMVQLYFGGKASGGDDLCETIYKPLAQLVSAGSEVFLRSEQPPLLRMTLEWCKALLSNADRTADMQYAFKVFRVVLAHYHGRVDAAFADIFQMTVATMVGQNNVIAEARAKEAAAEAAGGDEDDDGDDFGLPPYFRSVYVLEAACDVISQLLYYNAGMFFEVAGRGGDEGVKLVMNLYLDNGTDSESEGRLRLTVLGLSSVLAMPRLPPALGQAAGVVAQAALATLRRKAYGDLEGEDDGDEGAVTAGQAAPDERTLAERYGDMIESGLPGGVAGADHDDDYDTAAYEDTTKRAFEDVGDNADAKELEEPDANEMEKIYEMLNGGFEFTSEGVNMSIGESPLDAVESAVFFIQALETRARHDAAWFAQWQASLDPLLSRTAQEVMQAAQEMAARHAAK